MKKYRFEELTPKELLEIQEREEIVYLPVGSMEWHSLHLGMGVDAVHAEGVALGLAKQLGGAVFPPLFIGTEEERKPEALRRLGFSGEERILGMDFPGNSLKSCYWPPELFARILETQVGQLREMGFPRIVILNGHAAGIQKRLLNQLESHRVLAITVLFEDCGVGVGHAGLLETALMQELRPRMVELEELPTKEKQQFLPYKEYGISDSGGHETDFFVHHDPRNATRETGERILEFEIDRCAQIIRDWIKKD